MLKNFPALFIKEILQIRRDTSSLILAFIIPVLMLMLFGWCINLDTGVTTLAVVMQDEAPPAHRLLERLAGSPNFHLTRVESESAAMAQLQQGKVHAALLIPSDFSQSLARGETPSLMLATDGSVPNTAQFSAMYVQSVCASWQAEERGSNGGIQVITSYRFNPSAISRYCILPGSIAVVLSFIGTFLTAMVIAREWERGTMEALLASSASRIEFLLSKLMPYFLLGLGALAVCVACSLWVFGLPMHASLWSIFGVGGLFLISVLSQGLLISGITRSQFSASIISLFVSVLPTILLCGFVYEISSMPRCVQLLCYFIPARYLVNCLTTLFLAGPIRAVLVTNILFLAVSALFWFLLVVITTPKRLDS